MRVGQLVDAQASSSGRGSLLAPGSRVQSRSFSQHGRRSLRVATMAPDKSHLVTNLNNLLRMTPGMPETDIPAAPSALADRVSGMQPGPGPVTASAAAAATVPSLPPALQSIDGEDYHPSDGWRPRPHHLTKAQLWERIRNEARMDAAVEPSLATFLHSVVLSHSGMEAAMAFLLANKLADSAGLLGAVQVMSLIQDAYADDPGILEAGIDDLQSVMDRDPACSKYSQCMLYFKGFQAVQCYRVTHWLWRKGRKALAVALQSRISELFAVDIHPAAQLGRGIMLDHATGIVIGETAVVGDNVSMLHHVSLGGSGTGRGTVRHPHIGHGVLLGAGVTVLGPITVGAGSKVGAGSVVVTDLPEHCVAVGVPAAIIKRNLREEPVHAMDQCTDFVFDYVI